ncbi:unnamed protein product [Urochloa decumbens]|uniref:3'-5' exonuclease domain-containing protein n=1 Tax=Urochloa decumbens TaxID=240449 RepID=A0ABC9AAN7_9POAL
MGETKLYTVMFEGDAISTTVTSSGDAVKRWLDEVLYVHRRRLHKLVVGLDVEWRPALGPWYNPTALLQLCVGRRCLVFQLLHADYVPDALAEFLDDPRCWISWLDPPPSGADGGLSAQIEGGGSTQWIFAEGESGATALVSLASPSTAKRPSSTVCLTCLRQHRRRVGDNTRFRFVGVGVQDDAVRLNNDLHLAVSNTVDLAELAADEMGRPDLRSAGLKALASVVMGATVDKPERVRKGRWDAYELSDQQIKYACIDAFVSFEVGRKLLSGDC